MTAESLAAYRAPFKAAVLQHIQESLGADEWSRLREFAGNERRHVERNTAFDIDALPQHLLDIAVSEDRISIQETLVHQLKVQAVQIAEIAGQPLYYVRGQGIYCWGLDPIDGFTLSFWVTFPAYPPNW